MCIRRILAVAGLMVLWLPLRAQDDQPTTATRPEMRGVWVTRFEWPDKSGNAAAMKDRIAVIMETLAQNHFNAVFFQVRGQADALYPSPFEPWSHLIGGRNPGFDPLAYAIGEAHKRGLEFHAYINAFPCWSGEKPPENPNHAFHQHQDWLCRGKDGNLAYSEYYYFSPGIPEVQAYVRAIIMDVVERYDVDGIHLDRIRYPGPEYSRDPVSLARFEGNGNPGRLSWEDWQRAQITGFCNDLYGQIQNVKPRVKLSSSVWGIYDRTKLPGYGTFSSGFQQYYQDSQAWARMGVMDALVPMIYWNIGGRKPDYDELYSHFLENSWGRHIYGGIQTKYDDNPQEPILEIEYTRSVNGYGIVGFSYSGIDRRGAWPLYKAAYAAKAPVPPMPWKTNPSTGAIVGVVAGPDGKPIADAWVQIEGVEATWLTSADGLFSLLNLPPGSRYNLVVQAPGLPARTVTNVMVEAGYSTLQNVRIAAAPAPADPPEAVGAEANTAPATTQGQ